MITADPQWWAPPLFNLYIDRLMRRHFHSIRLLGDVPDTDADLPLLLTPNHSTWWDGFFVYLLNRRLWKRPFFLMMLEEQLVRNPFFRKLGVYGIRQDGLSEIRSAVNYTVQLLNHREGYTPTRRLQALLDCGIFPPHGKSLPRGPILIWYPQGELLPFDQRPLGVKRGLERIVKWYGKSLQLMPVGIKPMFLLDQRPDLFMQCGEPVLFEGGGWQAEEWDNRMMMLLDDMARRVVKGERGTLFLKGSLSVNERMDKWGERFRRILR